MLDLRSQGLVSPRDDRQSSADLELFAFTSYLLKQWPIFGLTCGISVSIVIIVSLLLAKKYTATVTILIEPPAGNDPRSNTAVSPVYLESLKTYEHFASSDSLFEEALERLDLRREYESVPIESIKRRVLQVSKPRDTKVLEVSATLPDRLKALDLARYIAEHTVEMNQRLDKSSIQDLSDSGKTVLVETQKRLDDAKVAHNAYLTKEPVAGLESEVSALTELRARIQRDLSDARVELVAYEARNSAGQRMQSGANDFNNTLQAIEAEKAQITSLEKQLRDVALEIDAKSKLLEKRKHNRELLEKEVQSAQAQVEAARNRNNDIFITESFRGERLEIIDRGVLPEKPSSPNVPLNVALALLASIIGTGLYSAIAFTSRRRSLLLHYSISPEN